jgi:hypothetical protein
MAIRVVRQIGRLGALALLLAGFLLPATAAAQQGIVPLQLSVSDPGARSMGFGGAFVALGDDATAAFANPAGLVQLLKPEISVEGRHRSYSEPYTRAGRIEGQPTGIGIDTLDSLQTARSHEDIAGLSFLSFAYPMENWSLAFFRHEYARHEFTADTQGLFGPGSACCEPRYVDQRATSELDFLSYGFSAAWRVSDEFDVGLGLVYHDASLVSNVSQFFPDDDTPESMFLANSYLPERSILHQRSTAVDTAVERGRCLSAGPRNALQRRGQGRRSRRFRCAAGRSNRSRQSRSDRVSRYLRRGHRVSGPGWPFHG